MPKLRCRNHYIAGGGVEAAAYTCVIVCIHMFEKFLLRPGPTQPELTKHKRPGDERGRKKKKEPGVGVFWLRLRANFGGH
jgi:hypothetical protein